LTNPGKSPKITGSQYISKKRENDSWNIELIRLVFISLANCPFVCWVCQVNKAELNLIDDTRFTKSFVFNEKEYRVFEGEKGQKSI